MRDDNDSTHWTARLNIAARDDHPLMAYVHAEMYRLARRALGSDQRQITLSTGVIVNEAYLKLFSHDTLKFRDRGHFLAIAATAMRQILLDHARQRLAEKRGSGDVLEWDALGGIDVGVKCSAEEMVAIDAALRALAQLDPRACRVFEMRFFGGMEVAEVGAALGISTPTVKRDARFGRAFISEQLGWTLPESRPPPAD